MIKKILDVKQKSLREKSKSVKKIDKKVLSLITDMEDTLAAQKDPEGVGLAAPQIGVNLRIFLMKYEDNEKVVINPKILDIKFSNNEKKKKKKNRLLEGCLSLPHYYGPLKREDYVKISYQDLAGKEVVEEFKGFLAQIVLHEIDHLEGVLFIDRILEQNSPLYHFHGEEWEEVDLI